MANLIDLSKHSGILIWASPTHRVIRYYFGNVSTIRPTDVHEILSFTVLLSF